SMQERYGPPAKKPEQKKLSRKDLGLDESAFRALDANGDGVLDAGELAGFVSRAPDLEVVLRLGTKGPPEAASEVREAGAGSGARVGEAALLDRGLTRVELRTSGERVRNEVFSGLLRQQVVAQFKGADKDGNGYLDKKEADANRLFKGMFKALDRDGDGKVTEKELL